MRNIIVILFFPALLVAQPFSINFENKNLSDWTQFPEDRWEIDSVNPIAGKYSLHHKFDNDDKDIDRISYSHPLLMLNDGKSIFEFTLRYNYNPTSGNYWGVYFISNLPAKEMYKKGAATAYFLGVGDQVLKVWKQKDGGNSVSWTSDFNWKNELEKGDTVSFRITRDISGNFDIEIDTTGSGNYILLGNFFDNSIDYSAYFGLSYTYSKTADRLLWMDNVKISGSFNNDFDAPKVDTIYAGSNKQIFVGFNEPVIITDSTSIIFNQKDTLRNITVASDSTFMIELDNSLYNQDTFKIANVADISGNVLPDTIVYLNFPVAFVNDLIISEIMADPNPAVDLPEKEYLEIYNNSSETFSLGNYKIKVGSTVRSISSGSIFPGEYAIVVDEDVKNYFTPYGKVLSVDALSTLNNTETTISILDFNDKLINSVTYHKSWHENDIKDNGGWSLELINFAELCKGSANWTSSKDEKGGTPGVINSVFSNDKDISSPQLNSCNYSDTAVKLIFNESLDSSSCTKSSILIREELQSLPVKSLSYEADELIVVLNGRFETGNTYHIINNGVSDCLGNTGIDTLAVFTMPVPDVKAPSLNTTSVMSPYAVQLAFDEKIELDESSIFILNNSDTAQDVNINSDSLVIATFEVELGDSNFIVAKNIFDFSGNKKDSIGISIKYSLAHYGEILVTEIMPDPTPVIDLPAAEYVEIYNNSNKNINLSEYTIDVNDKSAKIPVAIIPPESYALLCENSNTVLFDSEISVIGIKSMPSLLNSGATIRLKNYSGELLNEVSYEDDWYTHESSESGGRSLELTDVNSICKGKFNWQSSVSERGGTPGLENSVKDLDDALKMQLLGVENDSIFRLSFNQPMDSMSMSSIDNYFLDQFVNQPTLVRASAPYFNTVELVFSSKLNPDTEYELCIQNVKTCDSKQVLDTCIHLKTNPIDTVKPYITEVIVLKENELNLVWNEPVKAFENTFFLVNSGDTIKDFNIKENVLNVKSENFFIQENTFEIQGMVDTVGNISDVEVHNFSYYVATYHEVLITEIMCKPTDKMKIPNAEYLELYNLSSSPINLSNYKLIINGKGVTIGKNWVQPWSYIVLIHTSDTNEINNIARYIGVKSMPSLTNASGTIELRNYKNNLIHYVEYHESWYKDEDAVDGGYSLEMIDIDNACEGYGNWKASESKNGGTPGLVNSVKANNPDITVPSVKDVYPIDENLVFVRFSETMDSAAVTNPKNYSMGDDNPTRVVVENTGCTEIILDFTKVMSLSQSYELTISNSISDCAGNAPSENWEFKFSLPVEPINNSVVINEIMYNPNEFGSEFLEIYNNSTEWIDLSDLYIVDYDIDHQKIDGKSIRQVLNSRKLFPPQAYYVLVENKEDFKSEFPDVDDNKILGPIKLSLGNDGDALALIKKDSSIIDSAKYSSEMHYSLLEEEKGVSLERIEPGVSGMDSRNWHSASYEVGYSSPGKKNSQVLDSGEAQEMISLNTDKISPNNDGYEDYLVINYGFKPPGWSAGVWIFDINGELVVHLLDNELLSVSGNIIWDATDETGSTVQTGYYIVYLEAISDKGEKETLKKSCLVLP